MVTPVLRFSLAPDPCMRICTLPCRGMPFGTVFQPELLHTLIVVARHSGRVLVRPSTESMSEDISFTPFAEPPWLTGSPSPYYNDSHRRWQVQYRRFISEHVGDRGLQWVRDGKVPGDLPGGSEDILLDLSIREMIKLWEGRTKSGDARL